MKLSEARFALLFVLCWSTACASATKFELEGMPDNGGIAATDNSLRVVVAIKGDKGYRFCVEPIGPVARLQNIAVGGGILSTGSVNLGGKAAGSGESDGKDGKGKGDASLEGQYGTTGSIGAEVTLSMTEALARIYEVSEIMQLAHAMSFRLCEARANGEIKSEKEYLDLLERVFEKTSDIMFELAARDAASALPTLTRRLDRDDARERDVKRECLAVAAELIAANPSLRPESACSEDAPEMGTQPRAPSSVKLAGPPSAPTDPERTARLVQLQAELRELKERRAATRAQVDSLASVLESAGRERALRRGPAIKDEPRPAAPPKRDP